jgi:uncharacterized membrane protein
MTLPVGYPGGAGPARPRRRVRVWLFAGIGAAIVVVGVLIVVLSLDPKLFGLRNPFGFPFGGGFLGAFLVLWGGLLLVRVSFWAARRADYRGGPPGRRFDPAMMAARQRYARGEISRDQFEQIVRDLHQPPGTPPAAPPGPLR